MDKLKNVAKKIASSHTLISNRALVAAGTIIGLIVTDAVLTKLGQTEDIEVNIDEVTIVTPEA